MIFPVSAMSTSTLESFKVETSDGVKLQTRVFKPKDEARQNLVVVLVHPYSIMGGCQGLLRGIACGIAESGYRAVTFDMRGAGKSSGRASLTGFAEIKDVVAVCKWVCENLSVHRILLVGSSAGMLFLSFFCEILISDWLSGLVIALGYDCSYILIQILFKIMF